MSIPQAIKDLQEWRPEYVRRMREIMEGSPYYSPGDETAPVMSEAWAYCIFGKEDGRTFLALWNAVQRAALTIEDGTRLAGSLRTLANQVEGRPFIADPYFLHRHDEEQRERSGS
jgi:hypothetical protein